MLDAVELEKRGIPTVTFVTEAFAVAARAQATVRGMSNLPIIVVPHNFNWETRQEIEQKVGQAFGAVVQQLTQPIPEAAR